MDTKHIESVYALLLEQKAVQEDLLSLSKEKHAAIIGNDTEKLSKIVNMEYPLLAKMNSIEKRRLSVMSEVSSAVHKPYRELTISELVEMTGGDLKTRLAALQRELGGILSELREQNAENHRLLEAHIEYTDAMLAVIGGSEDPINSFYGIDGKSASPGVTMGSGIFDTEI